MIYYGKNQDNKLVEVSMCERKNEIPPGYYEITEIEFQDFITKPSPMYVLKVKGNLRGERARQLNAFDIYKTNIFYGIITETEQQRQDLLSWYNEVLNITELVTIDSLDVTLPPIPEVLKQYLY